MKVLLAICMLFSSMFAFAAEAPAAKSAEPDVFVMGKVLEVKNVDQYSYLRLGTKDGELWAAVIKANIKKGSTVTVENGVFMYDFQSKVLNKTFSTILFGSLAGAATMKQSDQTLNTAYPLLPRQKLDKINEAPFE